MLNFQQKFMRSTILNLVAASLQEAKEDGSRSLLKGIDTGIYFARGEVQKQVLQMVSRIVQNPSHPFHTLIQRAVVEVDTVVLQTVLANLGYVAFHLGVDQIRERIESGQPAPQWIGTLEASMSVGEICEEVRRSTEQGVYCYWGENPCQEALWKSADQYRECTFFAEFKQVTQRQAERLKKTPNVVAVLDADGSGFEYLARQQLLYGFSAEKIEDSLLIRSIKQGCIFGIYKGSKPEGKYSIFQPGGCGWPLLLYDAVQDGRRMQELIVGGVSCNTEFI